MQVRFYKKFELGNEVTREQIDFFNEFGFIHFSGFLNTAEADRIIASSEQVQKYWIDNDVTQVYGIPIKYGVDEAGNRIVQRFPFTNLFSEEVQALLKSDRLARIKQLLPGVRIGELERDGVVLNHYVNAPGSKYKHLGWHTDSARDIFYGKKVQPMLNVGLYLDDSAEHNGGLRILPGTHKQNTFDLFFRKAYFLNNDEDKNEVLVRAKKGDLVIHDGRMWHRVGQSPYYGERSRRRVMYIPFLVGDYQPKHAHSKVPFYLRFQNLIG